MFRVESKFKLFGRLHSILEIPETDGSRTVTAVTLKGLACVLVLDKVSAEYTHDGPRWDKE